MTDTLHLDVLMLLPELPDAPDHCVHRLAELLADVAGVEDAQVSTHEAGPVLVIRYDCKAVSGEEVLRFAREAGDRVTEAFGHMYVSLPNLVSAEAARRIERDLKAQPGVLSASVSLGERAVQIEVLRELISVTDIVDLLRTLGQPDAAVADPLE